MKPGQRFIIGVDPASRVDYFAAVVDEPSGEGRQMVHTVRHVERTRGLSYPLLTERLRILIERLEGEVTIALDATAGGIVVTDFLREANLPARLVPITFTSGNETRSEGGAYFVPKKTLISGLGLVLETSRLRLSRSMKHADVLEREFQGFTQTLSPSGHATFSAPSGQHDDLLSALSLALFLAEQEGSRGAWPVTSAGSSLAASLRRWF